MSTDPRVPQLSDAIIALVTENDWVTFVEINHLADEILGADARGNVAVCLPDPYGTMVLWIGMSPLYSEAVQLAQDTHKISMDAASWLAYLIDGGTLALPIAKRLHAYKKDHWLPVCFRPYDKVRHPVLPAKLP